MVSAEGIGEAQFDPTGARLLVEKFGPYSSSRNFAWRGALGRDRATLIEYAVDGNNDVQEATFGSAWIGSYSPNGSKVAFGWLDGETAKLGVYDFRTRLSQRLDLLADFGVCNFDCPLWLSEQTFIAVIPTPKAQLNGLSPVIGRADQIRQW